MKIIFALFSIIVMSLAATVIFHLIMKTNSLTNNRDYRLNWILPVVMVLFSISFLLGIQLRKSTNIKPVAYVVFESLLATLPLYAVFNFTFGLNFQSKVLVIVMAFLAPFTVPLYERIKLTRK
jgi:hypothetical protein